MTISQELDSIVAPEDLVPTMSLSELSQYVEAVITQRGFSDESPRDIMLLMVEEVGELAKALRKSIGLKIDQNTAKGYTDLKEEIADVFIYLLDLCNATGVDLFTAFKEKEMQNEQRCFGRSEVD